MNRTPIRLPRPLLSVLALFCAVTAASPIAHSQGTRLWPQTHAEDLEHGTPQGVTITSDGKLRFGPAATEQLTTPSTFIWGIVEEPEDATGGNAVDIATGSPATVLHNDKPLFTSHALAVTALALGPDGNLYAATMPDGKIYKLDPKSPKPLDETTAPVVFDLAQFDSPKPDATKTDSKPAKSRYIWQLTFDKSGNLFAATGAPGVIYKIPVAAPAKAALFFSTDEAHIRSLAWDKQGNLIAGSDGSGLIYRISPEGKGYVLFSAPRREIPALAVAADGTIYAADLGDKSHNPLPQLPVQNGLGITITFSQPGSVQAANASTTLPEGTEIYALAPNQAPRKIWSGKDEIVYGLAAIPSGILAFTGNRGRILEIHPDGSSADLAHLDAQQVTAFQPTRTVWLIGTSNTGRLYALAASKPADTHTYSSDVLDSGSFSRWGRIEVDPSSHGYKLLTRSGNIEQPIRNAKDWGWTDWQPLADGRIASPPGRYLQWKAVLQESGELSVVAVNYLPVNSAPVVDEILVVPGARVTPPAVSSTAPTITIAFPNPSQTTLSFDGGAGTNAPLQAQKDKSAVTVRWAAHDDNADDLTYDLYLRGDGESIWRPLKKSVTDKYFSFDASTLPDGGYQVKVIASDSPAHTPADALTGEAISERFELDTTPPVLSALKATTSGSAIAVTLTAHDATSPITRAEYSLDAGPWQYVEPIGDLSDSPDERYDFRIPLTDAASAEHLVTVRVYDRHDNIGAAKAVVPALQSAPTAPTK